MARLIMIGESEGQNHLLGRNSAAWLVENMDHSSAFCNAAGEMAGKEMLDFGLDVEGADTYALALANQHPPLSPEATEVFRAGVKSIFEEQGVIG
jgi:hypothetical protein